MTLVEVLVTMVLIGAISAIVLAGVQQVTRVLSHTDDENRGLQDAKVILDRLSTDIRQARGVVCTEPANAPNRCEDRVQLWIDDGAGDEAKASNYLKEPEEVVTWELTQNDDGEHFDVWRVQGLQTGAPRKLEASALIVDTIFKYRNVSQACAINPATPGCTLRPEDANLVTLELKYDAISDRGVEPRMASVSARLRNKG